MAEQRNLTKEVIPINTEQFEKRNIDIRGLVGANDSDESLRVSGYVNETGTWSRELGKTVKFKETIEEGAFKRAIERAEKIDFLLEHNTSDVLASTSNDSLTLREDGKGLFMSAEICPTSWGKDAHQLIKDNLLQGMSFGMKVLKDSWKKLADGTYERTISDLALFEITATRNPAYEQSNISARSLDVVEDPKITIKKEQNFKMKNLTKLTLKELKENYNAKLDRADELEEIGEVRSHDSNESLEIAKMSSELRKYEDEIAKREKASYGSENREVKTQNQDSEVRAVEQFIRKEDGEELRTVQTTSTDSGQLLVPTHLSNLIVEKLLEAAPIFSRTKNFTPVNGFLEILREDTFGDAGFVGEMADVATSDFTMTKVKLEQKRVGTAIELSKHLIHDSGINVVDYATGLLSKRLGLTIDKAVLNGVTANGEFEGVVNSVSINDTVTASDSAITIDELLDTYNSLNPEYIGGAVCVVNRQTFNKIAKLKDDNGQFYLVRDVAETGVTHRLFGQPVIINDAMPPAVADQRAVLFANFAEGYATMTKQGFNLMHINNDTTQALRGSHLIMMDGYMDGKILNEAAIKGLKMGPSA